MKKLMDHQTCQGKRIRFEERKGSRKTENIARIVCFWQSSRSGTKKMRSFIIC